MLTRCENVANDPDVKITGQFVKQLVRQKGITEHSKLVTEKYRIEV